MRQALGDGYVEALRAAYPAVPESADLVMFWWHCAALLLTAGKIARFGFITTNSLTQTFNRRVLEAHLGQHCSLTFAIPDHPWVDSADGAAVRVAMTVAVPGKGDGRLLRVVGETPGEEGEVLVELVEQSGLIHANLQVGANVTSVKALESNENLSNRGFCLFGAGFIVTPEVSANLGNPPIIHDYRNGRDLADKPRGVRVIDAWGLSEPELRHQYPAVWQWLAEHVKPEREHNNRASRKKNWWLFGEPNPKLRQQLAGLPRYIATVKTAKHRTFQFLDASIAPDNMLVCIALDDAYALGVLSSRVHVVWALAAGGTLEDRPRYNKTRCFEPFPFPAATPDQQARIRDLAEALDAHRKRQQAAHPAGTVLSAKDKLIHEQGLVAVLKQLHDELDQAVLEAYGWADQPDDAALLERLVALNAERAREEADGSVRWLRPAFQQAEAAPAAASRKLDLAEASIKAAATKTAAGAKQPWPKDLPGQLGAVAQALRDAGAPVAVDTLAARFAGKRGLAKTPPGLLAALEAVARAQRHPDGRYSAS